jgi:hypothetical protein
MDIIYSLITDLVFFWVQICSSLVERVLKFSFKRGGGGVDITFDDELSSPMK